MDDFQEFKQWQEFQKMKKAVEKPVEKPPPPPSPPSILPLRVPEFVPNPKAIPSFAEILATTPASPPPPPPPPAPTPRPLVARGGGGGGSTYSDDSGVNKMDYVWLLDWTIKMKPYWGEGWSEHPNLFLLFQHFYETFPERFAIISEIHADNYGRTYFSYRYQRVGDKGYTTFHAYGHFVGRKFLIDSVDIHIGKQEYHDAAKFNNSPKTE